MVFIGFQWFSKCFRCVSMHFQCLSIVFNVFAMFFNSFEEQSNKHPGINKPCVSIGCPCFPTFVSICFNGFHRCSKVLKALSMYFQCMINASYFFNVFSVFFNGFQSVFNVFQGMKINITENQWGIKLNQQNK